MKCIKAKDFDLKNTLECGQFFRYKNIDGIYYVNVSDKFFAIRQAGDVLYFEGNIDRDFLVNFFSLDVNYKKIIRSISKDAHITGTIKKYYGLRIIRQEPWECLISYLCSSASNIPKIKKNIELKSEFFGRKMMHNKIGYYAFPEIGCINDLEKLKKTKAGFRCKYIFDVNHKVDKKYFEKLKKMNCSDAKKELIKLPGVGEKIADCVLLFSLGKNEAFPVDVWMRRIMQKLYFKNKKISDDEIREFAVEHFGKYAGWAQEFLYVSRKD